MRDTQCPFGICLSFSLSKNLKLACCFMLSWSHLEIALNSLKSGIFPNIFYCRYSVVKLNLQLSFKSQSSILFTSTIHISLQLLKFYSLYTIRYKSTSKKGIFLVFFLLEASFLAINRVSNRKIFITFHELP